jgi:hypothetical protein
VTNHHLLYLLSGTREEANGEASMEEALTEVSGEEALEEANKDSSRNKKGRTITRF